LAVAASAGFRRVGNQEQQTAHQQNNPFHSINSIK
jgi:hypothetical protein